MHLMHAGPSLMRYSRLTTCSRCSSRGLTVRDSLGEDIAPGDGSSRTPLVGGGGGGLVAGMSSLCSRECPGRERRASIAERGKSKLNVGQTGHRLQAGRYLSPRCFVFLLADSKVQR